MIILVLLLYLFSIIIIIVLLIFPSYYCYLFFPITISTDDEEYAPIGDVQEPTAFNRDGDPTAWATVEAVTQSCAWWYNTTIAQNSSLCKDNYYAHDFTKDQVF